MVCYFKLDSVGSVDNRPSTDKLQHFVKKNVIPDTWHMTHDMWHVKHDMWHMVGGEHSFKISFPQLLCFGIDSILKFLNKRITYSMNEWIQLMFIEQPQLNMAG